ncbi:MAG: UDP-3-O-acyl-N-acetylglucosamine deacetylase [Neisseriaceae bacterium]
MLQRTLKSEVKLIGVGLHSGERVNLSLSPLGESEGVQFLRTDLEKSHIPIRLDPYLINDTRLSSTIVTRAGIKIRTIEHLMSALCALGIDNILITLDGPEIPIMDGSSLSFIHVMQEVGIQEQRKEKTFLRIKKPIRIEEGDKEVELVPYEGFKIKLTIDFEHPVFKKALSSLEIDFSKVSYIEEIARARTFGFMHEIEFMRSHQLGLGGNLSNAIVVSDTDVLNVEGLRYPDEFVRHKILDAIGDLYVIGYPVIGYFKGYKSGHAINNALLRKLLEDKNNYEKVTFVHDQKLPNAFHHL